MNVENKHTMEDLKKMKSLPLWRKIQITQTKILEYGIRFNENIYVSFSGGKDSTVLLDLARRVFPDIKAVYFDSGLDFPEIREFVLSFDNVNRIIPRKKDGTRYTYSDVIKKYGYPVTTKEQASFIHELRNTNSEKLKRIRLNGNKKGRGKISNRWIKVATDADFLVSDMCCDIFKKHPAIKFEKETGLHPIIATMTEESKQRESNWLMYGCNGFEKGRPTSNPMSFWTSNDVMEYINTYKIPYCDKIYGEIIIDPIYNQECFYRQKELNYCKNFKCTGRDRTGCIFCMFGCHLEKPYNRFQLLKKTHRKLWDYCMGGGEYNNDGIWVPSKNGLGMAHVLDFCEIKYE